MANGKTFLAIGAVALGGYALFNLMRAKRKEFPQSELLGFIPYIAKIGGVTMPGLIRAQGAVKNTGNTEKLFQVNLNYRFLDTSTGQAGETQQVKVAAAGDNPVQLQPGQSSGGITMEVQIALASFPPLGSGILIQAWVNIDILNLNGTFAHSNDAEGPAINFGPEDFPQPAPTPVAEILGSQLFGFTPTISMDARKVTIAANGGFTPKRR